MCVIAVAGMSIVPADEKVTAPERKIEQETELVKSMFSDHRSALSTVCKNG